MEKAVKLSEKEKDFLGFLISLLLHDYREYTLDIISANDDKVKEIPQKTWGAVKKLITLRDSYIKVDEAIIDQFVSESSLSKEEAKSFLDKHTQEKPDDKVFSSLALDV